MARRKDLNGVAAGLVGTFVSRNNDLEGYWSLGRLRTLADRHQSKEVVIDILRGTASLPGRDAAEVSRTYRGWLLERLAKIGIPTDWVKEAKISLQFGSWEGNAPPPQRTWGDPFVCRVSLVDDQGRTHMAGESGWCAPHNSQRESRSLRAQSRLTRWWNGLAGMWRPPGSR